MRYCSFDLETTGVDVTTARIVTAACYVLDTDTGQSEMKEWVADPGVEIPEEAANVHGWTTEKAREHGRPHEEVVWEVAHFLETEWKSGSIVVVYNAAYDLSLMHVLTQGAFTIRGPVQDPLVLDRAFDKYRKGSRKLIDTAAVYGVQLTNAHAADADALASIGILRAMQEQPAWHAAFFGRTLPEQMEIQQHHYAEYAHGLERYFASKGQQFSGGFLWPIQQSALDLTGSEAEHVFTWKSRI